MQDRRERIVDQFPMRILALEVNTLDFKIAIADIADRQRAFRPAARFHAAEAERSANGELAGRRIARNPDAMRTRRIGAGYGDRGGVGSYAGGGEANRYWQRASRRDG